MYLYPKISDSKFNEIINKKKEFRENKFVPVRSCETSSNIFRLQSQQRLLKNYINPNTQFRFLLIFHGTGVGKTCAAVTIAENFVPLYRIRYIQKRWNEEYIYILSGSDARENFKKELAGRCAPYHKPTHGDPITAEKEFRKVISKPKHGGFYQLLGYQEFANRIERGEIKTVTNCLIIIDEAHMTTENTFFDALKKIFAKSKSYRVVLLSATPMIHFASEIIDIFSLFSVDLKNIFTGSRYDLELTPDGKKQIAMASRGIVSRLRGENPATFPRRIEMGDRRGKLRTPVLRCQIRGHQLEVYKKKYHGKIGTTLRPMLDMVMPDGTFHYSPNVTSKYWGEDGVVIPGPYLKLDGDLQNCSAKYTALIKNLRNSVGKVFIYHRNVRGSGVKSISNVLIINGISQFVYGGKNENTFIVYHGELSPSEKKHYLSTFNSPENRNGEIIKYIVGSEIMMQSVDLKDVREVHIMHYQNNISTMEQIIGRAVRHCSHRNLPRPEWTVKVFRYSISLPSGEESAEELRYRKKEKAYLTIKEVEEIMENNSIDCLLNGTSQNCFPGEKINPKTPVDTSTYEVTDADALDVLDAVEDIKQLFSISPIWTLENIIQELRRQKPSIEHSVIYRAIQKILDDKYTVLNPAGFAGIVVFRDGYYVHKTNGNIKFDRPEYLFLPQSTETTSYNVTDLLDQIQISSRVSIHKHADDLKHDLLELIDPIEVLSYMTKLPMDVQKMILERCIVAYIRGNIKENTVKILRAYKDFLVTDVSVESDISTDIPKGVAKIIGHMLTDPPLIYQNNTWKEWKESTISERGIENDIAIGFMDRNRNGDIVMKILLPSDKDVTDRRKLNKGFVCGQISNRGVLVDICKKLSLKIFADESMDLLCSKIQNELRRRQREEKKKGGNIRWFYEYPEYIFFFRR
jgi:hypothetical protein